LALAVKIVDRDRMAGSLQVAGHRQAHAAHADEMDLHGCVTDADVAAETRGFTAPSGWPPWRCEPPIPSRS
jgi:hypothetical protein